MIPIIVADDEKLDLEHLLNVVNYRELGLEVVAACREGRELLRRIEELNPQIVITDIVMPEMSGLEIAHKLKDTGRSVRLVLVTGHQNFQYAKSALEYNVTDYIVKPVLPEQLKETLTRLVAECIEENRRVYEQNLFKQQLEANMPLLREVVMRQLIEGRLPGGAQIKEKMKFCGIDLRPSDILALLVLPSYGHSDMEYDHKLAHLSVKNAIAVFFRERRVPYCDMLETDSLSVLFNPPDTGDPQKIITFTENLHDHIFTKTGVHTTIGVGQVADDLDGVPRSFLCAQRALDARFMLGGGHVISFSDIEDGSIPAVTGIKKYQWLLCDAVNGKKGEAISDIIGEIKSEAEKNRIPIEYLRIFCIEILSAAITKEYESGGFKIDGATLAQHVRDIVSPDSREALMSLLERILLQISHLGRDRMTGRVNSLVGKISNIINEQYAGDISVESIAKQAYISSGYAARIFRSIEGISINAYITNVRMKKAAELLKLPERMIKDVSKSVGYANIAYFSSVFRKQFGQTPSQYRKMYIGSE